MEYRLLNAFASLFEGHTYLHRRSNLGDMIAREFYEDLRTLGRSRYFLQRVGSGLAVLNTRNLRVGIEARRGDGSFGEVVPGVTPVSEAGYSILRGPIATIEIGIEVKILFKAMIKQIDRVMNDLRKQAEHFKSKGGNPICVGITGVNYADHCTSYEGARPFPTDGRKYKHPVQEAHEAESRLVRLVGPVFDEFLVLRFAATNEEPYQFNWRDHDATAREYGAILARVSRQYETRFRN
ncbi:MAG: hypothetical protein ACREQE_06475 [Candidatus Binataceae bacterium]